MLIRWPAPVSPPPAITATPLPAPTPIAPEPDLDQLRATLAAADAAVVTAEARFEHELRLVGEIERLDGLEQAQHDLLARRARLSRRPAGLPAEVGLAESDAIDRALIANARERAAINPCAAIPLAAARFRRDRAEAACRAALRERRCAEAALRRRLTCQPAAGVTVGAGSPP